MTENISIENKQVNYVFLDLLKLILAILVVIRHCGQSFFGADFIMRIINSTITPLAVPTYFAISGFLFFSKKNKKVLQYVKRILALYLIWTVIYFPLIIWNDELKSDFLQKIVFDASYFHLWYLPSLIFAVLAASIVSNKIRNEYMLVMTFVLYLIGALVDTYSFLTPLLEWTSYKAIFITTRNGLFFGLFFVMIGKYLAEEIKNIRICKMQLVLGIIILCFEGYFLAVLNGKRLVNMSLASIGLVPVILKVGISKNEERKITYFENCRKISTLLFCIHPYFITIIGFIGRRLYLDEILCTLLTIVVSTLFSYGIIKLSTRVKILTYLM